MTKKSLLFIGALALSTVSFASTKSYEILIVTPTQAGAMQLDRRRVSAPGGRLQRHLHQHRHQALVRGPGDRSKPPKSTR